jgi:biopolymer transport protein ExbD
MKHHLSKIVFGCLGLCVGFTLCYVNLVVPVREAKLAALAAQQSSEEQIVITIARDGSLRLADRRVDLKDLATTLKKLGARGQSIRINADKGAPWSRVVEVMDACKAARAGKGVLLATATTR